jgi:hypothetical protein
MNECEASKISLLTLRDFLKDPTRYRPLDSMRRSIDHQFGPTPLATEFKFFMKAAKASPLDPNEAEDLRKLVRNAIATYGKSDAKGYEKCENELRGQLEHYANLKTILRDKLERKNEKLFIELEPILTKIEGLADLGLIVLDYARTFLSSDSQSDSLRKNQRESLDAKAAGLKQDRTQALGEIDFRALETGPTTPAKPHAKNTTPSSQPGLPKVRTESPIIELYIWARKLKG